MTTEPNPSQSNSPSNAQDSGNGNRPAVNSPSQMQSLTPSGRNQYEQHLATMPRSLVLSKKTPTVPQGTPIVLIAIALVILGLAINNFWIGISGAIVGLVVSLRMLWVGLEPVLDEMLPPKQRAVIVAIVGTILSLISLFKFFGINQNIGKWLNQQKWDELGSLAEWTGAVGQIFIAVIAVYVAWRQYIISRDLTIQQNSLTIQQNLITQQQTIDTYFQGISDLVLDEEGLLEDWPQERLLAEGRTAAILSSVDASGKAKILRFLSSSKLLTPLERDRRLGRAIFDGLGGYAEDRVNGVRVIDLGVMLAKADLSGTDLRRTDLSEANLVGANLSSCDLVKANLSRTILYEANLAGADFKATRLFYGSGETATPRTHTQPPYANYKTGAYTGAVVENADFTNVEGLSEEQRQYCCAWGGEKTRATIPGGCEGIPNKLER
ncbi:pentapeptide repeat-containing protein [Coleofasciculus sp. FACHB-129]|uniref:pentapeptide repeat-containing protein n=1 Tax=Cyanophyceae TaxID=3028117 RepID=UPI001685AB3D|nr:pentapeptide repeat-containing protein [Coleofasciculus sp. FACHB-129]MBD1894758.1 pentapeptide repeat-containing protein [Coleofasciculus sp. FACHB-129]